MRRTIALALGFAIAFLGMPYGVLASAVAQQTPPAGGVRVTARNTRQQNLSRARVQLRAADGQVAGSGVTDASGTISFAGLTPGTYIAEILNAAGNVIGTGAVTVAAGATATVTVTVAEAGAIAAAAGGGLGLLGLGTIGTVAVIGAASAAAIFAIRSSRTETSPSR